MKSGNSKIDIATAVIVSGFTASVFFHYINAVYLKLPYPHNTFLFLPQVCFSDFWNVFTEVKNLNPYLGAKSSQYPFLLLISYPFTLLPFQDGTILLIYSILFASFLTYFISFHLPGRLQAENGCNKARRVFVFSFMTYPFLFTIDRGNLEGAVLIFLLCFIYFFVRKRYLASSLFLSAAIAAKMFPVVLLLLFFSERRYREIIVAIAGAVVLTAAGLLLFRGGIAANAGYLVSGANFSGNAVFQDFLSPNNYVQRGVTLLTLLKILITKADNALLSAASLFILKHYMSFAVLCSVIIGAFVAFVEKALWRRAALLVFAMLLLPPISADYKLIHLFIPLLLFLADKEADRFDAYYAVMFGLLLIPKDYLMLSGLRTETVLPSGETDLSIAVPLNILIMVFMTLLIMVRAAARSSFRAIADTAAGHLRALGLSARPASKGEAL